MELHSNQQASHQYGDCEPSILFDPNVYQYYPDTCAIHSQKLILERFGINMSADELREEAMLHGWYAEGQGTPIEKVGELLRLHNVPVDCSEGNNIFNIANELAQHHQVIVAVDNNELYGRCGIKTKIEDLFEGENPNHALIVAGLDTSNPTDVKVILTDPGSGELRAVYSESEFMDAWKDSNCFMASTSIAPEEHLGDTDFVGEAEFAGFSHEHLEYLGGLGFVEGMDGSQLGEILQAVAACVISGTLAVDKIKKLFDLSTDSETDASLGNLQPEMDDFLCDGMEEEGLTEMSDSVAFDEATDAHSSWDIDI